MLTTGFYKHSAPLEPEHRLGVAWAALCLRGVLCISVVA
jgi:hypothetical protein